MEFFYSHNERYFHVVRAIQCKNSGIIPIISLNPQVSCKYIMRCRSRCFPKKCFLPNAPQNKMLPRKKCSLKKMLPEKKCSSENLLDRSSPDEVGVRYIGTSIRLGQVEIGQISFKSVDKGRIGEHFFSRSILKEGIFLGEHFFWGSILMESILTGSILFWGAFFGEHFTGSIWREAFVQRASDPKSH